MTIFASGFGHRTRREERLEEKQNYRRENISGVEFIWIRTFAYQRNDWRRVVNMLSYSFRVILLGFRFKGTPDVILASSPHPFAGLAGYILARLKKVRFIFEVRDLWPQTFVDVGGYSNKSLVVTLLRVLEKFLYRRAKKIIALLPKASEYIMELGIPSNKIVYIPNGVAPELFSDTRGRLPQMLDELISGLKSQGRLLVGYTGAHGAADGLDTILETAKILQDKGAGEAHFLLVGDGPEKKRLVQQAKSWGLSNISFFEPIPKDAMLELLQAIDITTVSLRKSVLWRYGTSKNKLFDYMICVKPVVWAIDQPDNPVAESNCGITVPQEDAEEMARAIMTLCGLSAQERQDMGMRGYEYVMKYHSVPVLANRLVEAIEDVKLD